LDELDVAALNELLHHPRRSEIFCYDLGCGLGAQGLRFAMLGARTVLVDRLDATTRFATIRDLLDLHRLQFVKADLRIYNPFESATGILPALVFSQRTLHYLKFFETVDLLKRIIQSHDDPQTQFYLSFSGLNSELSHGYVDRDRLIDERYAPLALDVAVHHHIHEPICLYTKKDVEKLAEVLELQLETVWESPFGNIKTILKRRCE
jgi:hypothetical protein